MDLVVRPTRWTPAGINGNSLSHTVQCRMHDLFLLLHRQRHGIMGITHPYLDE